jgi:hypothetical protein
MKKEGWISIVFGGMGVALLSFAAPVAWNHLTHKHLDAEHIRVSVRYEAGTVTVFVRNRSDEPLDLTEARVTIIAADLPPPQFGAYPEVSHVYAVDGKGRYASIERDDAGIVVKTKILQVIEPGGYDHFSVALSGDVVPPDLLSVDFAVVLVDSNGRLYEIKGGE